MPESLFLSTKKIFMATAKTFSLLSSYKYIYFIEKDICGLYLI